jgi:hypothetical protein
MQRPHCELSDEVENSISCFISYSVSKMVRIEEYLSLPNPSLRLGTLTTASTESEYWKSVEDIKAWFRFTYETLQSQYGDILKYDSKSLTPPPLLKPIETVIQSEKELELDPLKRDIIWRVNNALEVACKRIGKNDPITIAYAPVIACGTRFQTNYGLSSPEWVGTQIGRDPDRILCGETKLSLVFNIANVLIDTQNVSLHKPLEQLGHYCFTAKTRYGYIITDKEFVAIRWRLEKTNSGTARNRPRRATVPVRYSAASSSLQSMADMSLYSDNSQEGGYLFAEYSVVPWSATSGLTICLGLFWLALMAYGPGCDTKLRDKYEPLNRWKKGNGYYLNNTSGRVVKVLKNDQVELFE